MRPRGRHELPSVMILRACINRTIAIAKKEETSEQTSATNAKTNETTARTNEVTVTVSDHRCKARRLLHEF